MNKEIKAELDRELETLILRIIESDDAVRVVGLDDITEWVDQKLQQQYLQGAKDLWEAVKMDYYPIEDKKPLHSEGYTKNLVITAVNIKAQQFLDSLEK